MKYLRKNEMVFLTGRKSFKELNLFQLWPIMLSVVLVGGMQCTPEPAQTITHAAREFSESELRTDDPDELFQLGKDAMGARRNKLAIDLLSRVAEVRPDDIELHYWLGTAYWNREQDEESIEAYKRAIVLDPQGESPWSLYALENVAEVYTRTDRMEESKNAYTRALERETRNAWELKIKNQIDEIDLALGLYEPGWDAHYNDRGEIVGGVGPGTMRTNKNFEIARHTNDPEKEAKYYRLAAETDPTMYQPYFNLGLALVRQGKFSEAITWLERSDRVWKNDTAANPSQADKIDAYAFLSLCYLESGEIEKARQHARRALGSGSNYFWAALYDQRIKIASGRAGDALPVLEEYAKTNPEHAETLYALSHAYSSLGRSEEAHDTLVRAIESIPDNHPWMTRLRDEWELLLK